MMKLSGGVTLPGKNLSFLENLATDTTQHSDQPGFDVSVYSQYICVRILHSTDVFDYCLHPTNVDPTLSPPTIMDV